MILRILAGLLAIILITPVKELLIRFFGSGGGQETNLFVAVVIIMAIFLFGVSLGMYAFTGKFKIPFFGSKKED